MATLSQLPTDALEAVLRLCDAPTLSRLARTSRRLRACVQGNEALWCSHFGAHLAPHGHWGGGLGGGGTWPGTTATATIAPRSWAAAYSGWLRFRPSALQTLPPPEQQRTTELEDRRQVFALALTAAPSSSTAAAGGARLWAVDGRGRLRELALSTERPHTELRSACVTDGCAALTIAAAPPCSAAAAAAHELLVGSSDGSVRCWDARTDMRSAVWSCTAAHRDEVFCVQRDDGEFKGGSARFASTSADGRVCLWDARR
jgi:WD40 repeat protein